jgi:Domain of unknown function (DUF222)
VDEAPNEPPDEEIPPPDDSASDPASGADEEQGSGPHEQRDADPDDPPMAALNAALTSVQRMLNLAEGMRAEVAIAAFDALLIEEQARGVPVEHGDFVEKGFALHLSGYLQLSPTAARGFVEAARSARDSLANTWQAFRTGACGWRSVRLVADFAVGLEPEERTLYDAEAAALVVAHPPHELRRRLLQLRNTVNPQAAAARSESETKRRHVEAAPELDGQASLTFRGPCADIAAAHDALHRLAVAAHGREGETRPLGALMFDVGMDLILHGAMHPPVDTTEPGDPGERVGAGLRVPDRKAVQPQILITVPAGTATGVSDEPAAIAGFGTIGAREAQTIVAHAQYWTRILVDPVDGGVLAIDDHERYIPAGLRTWLRGRDGTCRAPGCGRSALRCDLDHTFGWACGGHTAHTNLASLCRSCHRIKEHGDWSVRTAPDGTQIWTSRWGSTRITSPILRPAKAAAVAAVATIAAADDPPPF